MTDDSFSGPRSALDFSLFSRRGKVGADASLEHNNDDVLRTEYILCRYSVGTEYRFLATSAVRRPAPAAKTRFELVRCRREWIQNQTSRWLGRGRVRNQSGYCSDRGTGQSHESCSSLALEIHRVPAAGTQAGSSAAYYVRNF
jgi:hypothetical protein